MFCIINEIVEAQYNKKKLVFGGHYTLGVIESSEDYENLKEPLNYLSQALDSLKKSGFVYKNKHYQINYNLGSDFVFASETLGINGPNSKFPCLHCHCSKDNFYDYQLHESNMKKADYQRSCANHLLKSKKLSKEKPADHLGYIKPSLFPNIEHSKYVIDTLHLKLNIGRVLVKLFLQELAKIDRYDGKNLNFDKHTRLKVFFDFLLKIKIYSKPFDSEKLISNLRGSDYDKLFNNNDTLFKLFENDLGDKIF